MNSHWQINSNSLRLTLLPYYWRKSPSYIDTPINIPSRFSMNATIDKKLSMLKYIPSDFEWDAIQASYSTDNTIGFLYEGSSQLNNYGSSVNKFFLDLAKSDKIKKILEIGCGGCLTLKMLKENGYDVLGIDPSEYALNASRKFNINLIKENFDSNFYGFNPDLIICNDVFEHILDPVEFSKNVYRVLGDKGIFGIATTSSELAISLGDISMMQHQHVNMFTKTSIYKILKLAGFSEISIKKSSYGDTFHIKAIKDNNSINTDLNDSSEPDDFLSSYLDKVKINLSNFKKLYAKFGHDMGFYVPIRCLPYLSSVGDYGNSRIFDGNKSWENLFIDGYKKPIENLSNKSLNELPKYFFIGSLSFFDQIEETLLEKGISKKNIFSLSDLINRDEKY